MNKSPKSARRTFATLSFLALLGSVIPPSLAAELRPPIITASWLDTVNYYRQASDLQPVKEDPQRTAMSKAHVYYLANTTKEYYVGQYQSSHTENPASPFYSELGSKSGSNIAWSNKELESNFIDQWMTAPFHAVGILRENLETSGFAMGSGPATPYIVGALDVFGTNYSRSRTKTIFFPGNNATVRLNEFTGENPDPREACGPDWKNFRGLPLFASFPKPLTSSSTGSLTLPDGSTLTPGANLCLVDQFNFTTSDLIYGPAGKSIMAGDNLVFLIPKQPLAPGMYTASISPAGGAKESWKFSVLPKMNTAPFKDNPEKDRIEWAADGNNPNARIQGYIVTMLKGISGKSFIVNGGTNFLDTSTLPDGFYSFCVQPFDESSFANCNTYYGLSISRSWKIESSLGSKSEQRLKFNVLPTRGTDTLNAPYVEVKITDENRKEVARIQSTTSSGYFDLSPYATGKNYYYCLFFKDGKDNFCTSGWFNYKPTSQSSSASAKSDGYPASLQVPGRTCAPKGASGLLFEVKLKCNSVSGKQIWVRADSKSDPILPIGTSCTKLGEKITVLNRVYICSKTANIKVWTSSK